MNCQRQPDPPKARCPKCGSSEGLRESGMHRGAKYDVLSDSFGVMQCPHCWHRAGWAEFHKSEDK